jgi:hypothetical protein
MNLPSNLAPLRQLNISRNGVVTIDGKVIDIDPKIALFVAAGLLLAAGGNADAHLNELLRLGHIKREEAA